MAELAKFRLGVFVIIYFVFSTLPVCHAGLSAGSTISTVSKKETFLKNKLLYIKTGNIWLFDPATKQNIQFIQANDVVNFSVSSDYNKIAAIKNNKLYIINAKTNEEVFLMEVETDMSNPTISPTNDKVIYISESEKEFNKPQAATRKVRHIWIVDLNTKAKVDLTKDSPYHHTAVQWSPDGRWVSFASSRGNGWRVYLMNMIDKKQSVKEIESGIFSSWLDNKTLAIGNSHSIKIYDVRSLKQFREIKMQPGFSPAKFAFAGDNNLYYEDMTENPDLDISHLDLVSGKKSRVIEDGRSPMFAK